MTPDPTGSCQKPQHLEPALRAIALITTVLVCGLILSPVLQAPGSRNLAGSQWLAVQHSFYDGFALVGGTAEITGLIASIWLAILAMRRRRWTAAVAPWIAVLCLLGRLRVFWVGNWPVTTMIASGIPATWPSDWPLRRSAWEDAHAASAGLSSVALRALAIAPAWNTGSAQQP